MTEDRPPTESKRQRRDPPEDGSPGGDTRYHQLRADGALYETLIETIGHPIVVADPDRQIIDCNRAFTDRFGYALEEITGRGAAVLYADRDEFEAVGEALGAGADDPMLTRISSYRTQRGATFLGETTVVSLRDDAGEVVAHVGLIRDVTDRKERERERERTIALLQGLYDVATNRTLDVDAKITRLLELGHETLGLPPGYLTRIEVSETDSRDGTQRIIQASGDHELLQPGNSCPLAQSYCRKTIRADGLLAIPDALEAGWAGDPAYELFNLGCYLGTRITVDDELYGTVFFAAEAPRSEPFSDAARTFLRLMSQLVSYELERDRAQRALQRQNDRLEQFASIISHDLRNPLNVAQGRLELAREEIDNEHLASVARAHDRMVDLIDELLTLARQGRDVTDAEPVHLDSCLDACWGNVDTADATLVADADRTVAADRSQLQQLFENLYRNAVEHGGDDVTITVGTLADGFFLEDDGAGIPEDERDAVFEAGYSTTEGGTGFGLNIVKQIVDAHDWAIRVTDGTDGGARFEITGVQFAAE